MLTDRECAMAVNLAASLARLDSRNGMVSEDDVIKCLPRIKEMPLINMSDEELEQAATWWTHRGANN